MNNVVEIKLTILKLLAGVISWLILLTITILINYMTYCNEVLDLFFIGFSSFFSFMCIYFLFHIIKVKYYRVYNDQIIIKDFIGLRKRIITFSNIDGWFERERKTFQLSSEELVFIHNNREFVIASLNNESYENFKLTFKNNNKELFENPSKIIDKNGLVFLLSFLLFFVIPSSLSMIKTGELRSYPDNISIVESRLSDRINYDAHSVKGSIHANYTIRLSKYPELKFIIEDDLMEFTNSEILNIPSYDTVKLLISEVQYKKKLIHDASIGLLDKTVEFKKIYVYGLIHKSKSYMIEENVKKKSYMVYIIPGYLFLILGVIGLLFTLKKIITAANKGSYATGD